MTQDVARNHVRQWLKSRSVFSPSALKNASVEEVRGVYLPAWLYSSVARTRWSAEIGEDYTETTTRVRDGKRVEERRTVTEWRLLSGDHCEYVADVLVTASKGLRNDELQGIEPFDLRVLHRYEPAIVSGWIAEDPTLAREQSMQLARDEALGLVGGKLSRFMPGDRYRELRSDTRFENESSDLVLVPIWVLAARWREDKPPLRVLVNGQTGAVHGDAPLSAAKIVLTVLVVLALIAAVVLFAGRP